MNDNRRTPRRGVPGYSTSQIAEWTGVTPRRIDYWCRTGLLGERHRRGPGSGNDRAFTGAEVDRIFEIAQSVRPNDLAAQIAEADAYRQALRELFVWATEAQSPTAEHHEHGNALLERISDLVQMAL